MTNSPLTRFIAASLFVPAAIACVGCADEEDTGPSVPAIADSALSNYADIVRASYEDSITSAAALDRALDAFVAAPSDATLADARRAWLASREPYLQTEVYRFYNGPIDNEQSGPEGLLNAWPLDEAYIDYVEGDADAGLVNDVEASLVAANLESLNEQGGEKNIATGYHAIEFLLWGQDSDPNGPGSRPFGDYVDGAGAPNHDRRGEYLQVASALMTSHLESLATAWDASVTGSYGSDWASVDRTEGVARVMTGMIILSGFETGGERLQTALDSGDQEDEHSCFSDNTHRDMVQDVRGVQNVWLGEYTRLDNSTVSGPGIQDVVAASNQGLADSITAQIAESLRLAEALQVPFDNEIALGNAAGRARVTALIESLQAQEALLEDAFIEFGLNVPVAE